MKTGGQRFLPTASSEKTQGYQKRQLMLFPVFAITIERYVKAYAALFFQ